MTRICPANTIDSNSTGFAIAEEVCPGVLPNEDDDGRLPVWYEQEPNTYPSDFGGKQKTVARAPIKRNRQRSKGTTVGLDVTAGFNADLTMRNQQRNEQGFFFADVREKASTDPINGVAATLTGITASSSTIGGSGFVGFRAGMLVALLGTAHSDGLYSTASASSTAIVANESVPAGDEVFPDTAILHHVGEHFSAGAIAITMDGNIPTIHYAGTAAVAASGAFTIAVGNAEEGDTATIGQTVYKFTAAPTDPYDVLLGGADTSSATNLAASINGQTTLNDADPLVTASVASNVVTVTARLKGTTGNAIATTDTGTNTSWGAVTLTSGAGKSLLSLGMIPGEWGYLGSDTANNHFANNEGYFRVGSISDTDIVIDRATWDAEAEAAGALTIDIFCGTLIQNENDPSLIKMRTYQGQRTLGNDADGVMSQYVINMVPSTLKMTVPLEDKLTVDLAWIAGKEEFRTGAQGLKAGTLVPALNEDAINSTNDLYEIGMSVVDPTNADAPKLFGFLSALDITINNNVSAVKGLGVLGSIGANVGVFQVSGTATAYFTSVAANIAITDNDDIDLHAICAKHNAGFVYDIGLLSAGTSGIAIVTDKPVTLPLTVDAAQNKNGVTLTKTLFQYLPGAAMPEQAA